ncbi:MAG: hypothetical protein QME47_07685, partial [Candidatus Thermoplasmatota archaeon]|nr:hypothetical protein [Candidatus Thermoplasmatota archaeon]
INDGNTRVAGPYYPLGNLTSPILDAGQQVLWGRIWWWNATVANTNIIVQINASIDGDTWSGWKDCTNGSWIENVTARYLRYRVILNTTDASVTPSFDNITIEYITNPDSHGIKSADWIKSETFENVPSTSKVCISEKIWINFREKKKQIR